MTANDSDPDGNLDLSTVTLASDPAHGHGDGDAVGSITYTNNGSAAPTRQLHLPGV